MDNQKTHLSERAKSIKMKKLGIIELVIAISGIVILLVVQNEWAYISLILYGVISVVSIRNTNSVLTTDERKCMKKRNMLSIIFLFFFAFICYYAANDLMRDNLLWILLTVYLFLAAHGIIFMVPINAFGNEKR